jgi:hypothetical protein
MKRNWMMTTLSAAAATALLFGAATVSADKYDSMTRCEMKYNLKGWSFAVKVQEGEGRITCDNGQRANVKLSANAIGLTIGVSEIFGGEASFTPVRNLNDLIGQYVALEAHAGMARSVEASVLTKGEVSMALGGSGNGVDAGATIGAFTIARK